MKKILGLDLGTTSIGWALVNEKENDEEKSSIVRLGVRVNPLSVDEKGSLEKGKAVTVNADRTLKRSARRNLQRYKLRRKSLLDLLIKHDVISSETPLYEQSNDKYSLYRYRALAASAQIPLKEFARVLLTINKKRGYKSLRKVKNDEEGTLVDGMDVAKILYDRHITPGQYLLEFFKKGKKISPQFYRSDLLSELKTFWDEQVKYYPDMLTPELYKALEGKNISNSSKTFYAITHVDTAKNSGSERLANALMWRVDGLSKKLDKEQVAYVICNLNGEINGSSQQLNLIGDRSKALFFNNQTIGQYLWGLLQQYPNKSLANIIFYRQDYEDEFNTIWAKQAQYYPQLTDSLRSELFNTIFFQSPLKSQKGLISYCELESGNKEVIIDGKKKTITIGCKVCPKASPLFQEFKIWQQLNNVRIYISNEQRPLYLEEMQILFEELNIKGKMSSTDVLKVLGLKKKEAALNFKDLEGNSTNNSLFNAYLKIISDTGNGEYDIKKLSAKEIVEKVTEIFKGLGYKTDFLRFDATLNGKEFYSQPYYRLWHLLYSYTGDKSKTGNDALINKLSELCGFEKEYAKTLGNVTFEDDFGNLSSKAIKKILPFLKEGSQYSDACVLAGYKSHSARSLTKEELEQKNYTNHIDLIPRNSLRNPVVEKILNQMVNVVNLVSKVYGKPDEIRIEMARELKKSREERELMSNSINRNTTETERIRKILESEFHITHVSRNDILRYRLYEELKDNGYKTIYSQTYIPREEIFGPKFNIEHIIPQARLFDDSFSNKTLETVDINIEKSNDTAFDFVMKKYGEQGAVEYKTRVNDLAKRGAISQTKASKLLMKQEDIPEDFIERDLRSSQYIARKATEILSEMVPHVVATTGSITERLREDWQLVNVMQELNWDKYNRLGLTYEFTDKNGNTVHRINDWTKRNDNRHHAMDALTIAFTKPSFIQYLNNLNARSNKSGTIYAIEQKELHRDDKSNKLTFNAPMPLGEFCAEAKQQLENILVSRKAKNKVTTENVNKTKNKHGNQRKIQLTPRGSLHKEHVHGLVRRYESFEIKVNDKLTLELINQVASKQIREALLARLEEFDGDFKKAFGKLSKNPIWLDKDRQYQVPAKVKAVRFVEYFTIKKTISPDLKIDKVEDAGVRRILQERLKEYNGKANEAFTNLDENPIWLNKEKGIAIKSVKVKALNNAIAVHVKHDRAGNLMLDQNGNPIPCDFVNTGNNHHIAIFEDKDGILQEHVVSFFEATERKMQHLQVVDRDYNSEYGWRFLFSMKQDEYFVFPNKVTGFNPADYDLMDSKNYALISPNLFRVQAISVGDYYFRHHLETNVDKNLSLKDITWKRIRNANDLKGIVKVRLDHLGTIVNVGEY